LVSPLLPLLAWALCALSLCTAQAAGAARGQRSARVSLPSHQPEALARQLEREGFDLLPDRAQGLQLVVSPGELERLRVRGLRPVVLERGRPLRPQPQPDTGVVPEGYLDPQQVREEMALLAEQHPSRCVMIDLTQALDQQASFEGRHLYALRISDEAEQDQDEPALLVSAGLHARELGTPLVALSLARALLEDYDEDDTARALTDRYEIWIVPICNPDGYAWVFEGDHMWRKNRRVFDDGVGVDLNRNFPFGWTADCAGSQETDSSKYKGPEPASEPETATLMALSQQRHFQKHLDIHSFGLEVRWGYACHDHVFGDYLQERARALSQELGYKGAIGPPSAEGEFFAWQLAEQAGLALLIETGEEFQPPADEAWAHAASLLPGMMRHLLAAPPLAGHVRDARDGTPLQAELHMPQTRFENGEALRAGGPFGRYHLFSPPAERILVATAAGYLPKPGYADLKADASLCRDLALRPAERSAGCAQARAVPGAQACWALLLCLGARRRRRQSA